MTSSQRAIVRAAIKEARLTVHNPEKESAIMRARMVRAARRLAYRNTVPPGWVDLDRIGYIA